jgi:hypothetical protein
MTAFVPRLVPIALAAVLIATPLPAQQPAPTVEQLKSWTGIRRERVNLLLDEIKKIDARIESRLDVLIETLRMISDSKDSRTKVARMKEDTGKRLMRSIEYYDQKRAALKEELRSPRLNLTEEEKRKMIAVFDERIEKRTRQILALNKSMPGHQDYERYKVSGGGWWGTTYERNEDFEQNQRMNTHSNTQRDAIVKQLETSIGRLERQSRTLKSQIGTADAAHRKVLYEELEKTEALIAERRKQKLEALTPSATATRTVALQEAMDLDKALQNAINELRREFTTLFQRYNTYLGELSLLHDSEAALAKAQARK